MDVLFSFLLITALLVFLMIAPGWKIYQKAGKPGWGILIPIYNIILMLEIVRKPIWWIILLIIPGVNVIVSFILYHQLSKAFGKGIGYTLGLLFLPIIFYPLLGFGDAQYQWKEEPAF